MDFSAPSHTFRNMLRGVACVRFRATQWYKPEISVMNGFSK